MVRIITYGLIAEHNLGCPSILHGIYELLRQVYHDDFEMINLQIGTVPQHAVSDMRFTTLSVVPFTNKQLFKFLLFKKDSSTEGYTSLSEVRNLIKTADAVINLYGILFCDRLSAVHGRKMLIPMYGILQFPFSAIAKQCGVRSIKGAASFGPAKSTFTQSFARWCVEHLFDFVQAREEKSKEFLLSCGVKSSRIIYSPDLANLMPVGHTIALKNTTVGISVSYQMVRQWSSSQDYIECITDLVSHIISRYGCHVMLIPNDTGPFTLYNDMDVAKDCLDSLQGQEEFVTILDAPNMQSTELKSNIAACEVVVASRYHSCVAALSAGVPLLVLGWHYKYEDLMRWYGQEEWILSEDDCDSSKLISMFDSFWEHKEQCRGEIVSRRQQVVEAVISAGRKMLEGE